MIPALSAYTPMLVVALVFGAHGAYGYGLAVGATVFMFHLVAHLTKRAVDLALFLVQQALRHVEPYGEKPCAPVSVLSREYDPVPWTPPKVSTLALYEAHAAKHTCNASCEPAAGGCPLRPLRNGDGVQIVDEGVVDGR